MKPADLPPWMPGVWRMVSGLSAGGRVELLDGDRERRYFEVRMRTWDTAKGITSVLLIRVSDGQKLLCTQKGWVEK